MSPEVLAELLAAPALPAPEGVTPNFDNPPNKNGLAWFVTTFCMVVATMCLFLRILVRLWLEKKLRVEECKLTSTPLHLRVVEHIANSNSFQSWSFLHTYVDLSFLFPFCPIWASPHAFQGTYWGTAYAGYALIYTPGYYVHTWNLHNEDLIRPLYVSPTCSFWLDHSKNIQWLTTLPADAHLRLLLFSHPAVDQNSHPDGLV